ncbi:MAG: tyrosine recombinase XerC [Sarcina sp.]
MKSESKDFFDSYDFFQKNSFKNQDIPSSLVDFLNYLETIKGKSPNTLKAYKGDLSLFFKFLKAYKFGLPKDVDLLDLKINELDDNFIQKIELRDLYAFLNYVEQIRSNGSYAKSRKVAALKSYFKFLQNKLKIIKENPAVELESPKIEKRNPKYLTLEESLNLLEKMDSSKKNYHRDYCILVLFLNCGMRLSELCNIKLSKLKEDRLSIIGKGDKERVVYLNNSCIKAIDNYLKVRDLTKVPIEFRDYLFISRVNKPIDKRTVELLVKKYIKEAGIGEGYTPHKLRHTAATLMYKYGEVDIRSIQNILGHESISTTQIYTHVDDDSLREAVKQNPLSNL